MTLKMDQGHRNWLQHVTVALNRCYDHVEQVRFILRQHLRKPSSISKAGAASIVPVDAVGESLKSHVG